jgi:hypothetical protein
MSAGGNSGRRAAAVSGQRGVLGRRRLSRTRAQDGRKVDGRKGKIVDDELDLDSAEAEVTRQAMDLPALVGGERYY